MAEAREHPNLFELACGETSILYTTSSIDGQPQLTYDHEGDSKTFRGNEIEREETSLGALVSVTLESMPDFGSETLSVLLPEINLPDDGEAKFRAVVVTAFHRSSIGGPQLVDGPLTVYKSADIYHGVARLVEF